MPQISTQLVVLLKSTRGNFFTPEQLSLHSFFLFYSIFSLEFPLCALPFLAELWWRDTPLNWKHQKVGKDPLDLFNSNCWSFPSAGWTEILHCGFCPTSLTLESLYQSISSWPVCRLQQIKSVSIYSTYGHESVVLRSIVREHTVGVVKVIFFLTL